MKYGRYTKIPADGSPGALEGTITIIENGGGSLTLGVLPRGRRKGKLELKARAAEIAALPKKVYAKPDPTRKITSLKYEDADSSKRIVTFKTEQ